jgi:hypothetical protein
MGSVPMAMLKAIVTAFFLFACGVAVAAETVYVNCPAKELRADISTKLPEGWWYTPTEGKLKNLRVQTIGADRVLVCLYQAFDGQVAVMQKAPANAGACHADNKQRRFVCQLKNAGNGKPQ